MSIGILPVSTPSPTPPLSIRIMGLGGNSRKIFDFKGVLVKKFKINELRAVSPPGSYYSVIKDPVIKVGRSEFGAVSRPILGVENRPSLLDQQSLSHRLGWVSVMGITRDCDEYVRGGPRLVTASVVLTLRNREGGGSRWVGARRGASRPSNLGVKSQWLVYATRTSSLDISISGRNYACLAY